MFRCLCRHGDQLCDFQTTAQGVACVAAGTARTASRRAVLGIRPSGHLLPGSGGSDRRYHPLAAAWATLYRVGHILDSVQDGDTILDTGFHTLATAINFAIGSIFAWRPVSRRWPTDLGAVLRSGFSLLAGAAPRSRPASRGYASR